MRRPRADGGMAAWSDRGAPMAEQQDADEGRHCGRRLGFRLCTRVWGWRRKAAGTRESEAIAGKCVLRVAGIAGDKDR